jgi:hypothetical protein
VSARGSTARKELTVYRRWAAGLENADALQGNPRRCRSRTAAQNQIEERRILELMAVMPFGLAL